MAGKDLSYWDYLKAAFHWKTALPLLGGMPLNKLALIGFAILGFGNPGFWLLGLAYEAGYLLLLSGHPRFQRLVRGRHLAENAEDWREVEKRLLARLHRDTRDRYHALRQRCQSLMAAEEGGSAGGLAEIKTLGLGNLLVIFLRLLGLRDRINDILATVDRGELEADIRRIQERMEREDPASPVHRALENTLRIQETRLNNLEKSRVNLAFTEAELERIEKQVSLIAEEAAVHKSPENWSMTLDGVVDSIQGTTRWMAENEALFDSLDTPAGTIEIAPGKGRVAQ